MSKLKNRLPIVVYLIILLFILGFLSLLIGPARISASKVFSSIFIPKNTNAFSIIWQIRMPRLMLAAITGTLVAMAGSIFLGIFGSSIIDSIVTKVIFGLMSVAGAVAVLLMAFGVGAVYNYYGILGSLSGSTWDKALLPLIFILAGIVTYIFYYKDLNALLFGEYTAKTLGVEVRWTRLFLFLIGLLLLIMATLTCGISCAALFILPYYVRLVTGVNYKFLIPVSIMSSISLVILLDIFSRIIFPSELPVGIVILLLSGPFYLYALQRRRLGL